MVRPVGQKPSKGAPYYAYGIYLKEKGSNYGEQYINKAHNIFFKNNNDKRPLQRSWLLFKTNRILKKNKPWVLKN